MKNKISIILCMAGMFIIGIGLFIHAKESTQMMITMFGMLFLAIGVSISKVLEAFFIKYKTSILVTSIIVGALSLFLLFRFNINGVHGWFLACVGILFLFTGLLSFKKVRRLLLYLMEVLFF